MQKIATAFVAAQNKFSPALKSSTNPHFRSQYADLAACVEAVIDALNENKIALMQTTHLCDDGVIIETVFLHESGETLSGGKLHVPAAKQDPQGYGSCLTYARRYSLMAACGIAPEDDDGNVATSSVKEKPIVKPKPEVKPLPPEIQSNFKECKNLNDLQILWNALPPELRAAATDIKEEMKARLA